MHGLWRSDTHEHHSAYDVVLMGRQKFSVTIIIEDQINGQTVTHFSEVVKVFQLGLLPGSILFWHIDTHSDGLFKERLSVRANGTLEMSTSTMNSHCLNAQGVIASSAARTN